MTGKRIQWVDIAKSLGIALVIVGHTFLNDSIERKLVFSMHMPLFFILAGYTFRVKPFSEVFSSSAKRLLVPYCLIFIARTTIAWVKRDSLDVGTIENSILSFFFASGTGIEPWGIPPAGMIWFLMALFCSRIIMNVICGFFEKKSVSTAIQFAFWFVLGLIGIAIGEPAKTLGFLGGVGMPDHLKLPLSLDVILVCCFLMYVGYLWKQSGYESILNKWWALPTALAIWAIGCNFSYLELAARRYDLWFCALIASFAGSFAIFWISHFIERHFRVLSKPLEWMGANSMMLFCIHAFDMYLAPWQSLPFVAMGIPCALLIAGLLRLSVDLLIMNVFRRV